VIQNLFTMAGCCVDLFKFLIFITNFVCFLVFGALLGGTIYVFLEGENTLLGQKIEPSLQSSNPTATYFSFIIIFIVIFSFFLLLTFLGCCGTAVKSSCMITTFIVIQFVLFGGAIGAVVFFHTKYGQDGVRTVMEQQLSRTVAGYSEENVLTMAFWDWVQPTLGCCGVSYFDDGWKIWTSSRLLPDKWQVPQACCRPDYRDCMEKPTIANSYLYPGCVEKVRIQAMVVFYGVPGLLFISLVLSFIVVSNLGNNTNRNNRVKSREERHETNSLYSTGCEEDFQNFPTAPYENAPFNPHYGHEMTVALPEPGYRGDPYLYPTGVAAPPHQGQILVHQAPPSYATSWQHNQH